MSRVDFIDNVLAGHDRIEEHAWIDEGFLEVKRKDYLESFTVGLLWERCVTVDHVSPFVNRCASFIANVPSIGLWQGDAIRFCEAKQVGWGRFGALLSAIGSDLDPRDHQDREIYFPRRALEQHGRVASVDFIFHKLMRVNLKSGATTTVALDGAYDLTSDDVRRVRAWLGEFDILLKNNPNGSITKDAVSAADSLGARVMKIGELLAYLAKL